MSTKRFSPLLMDVLLIFLMALPTFAQQTLPFIRVSPQSEVSQSIGFAKIEIEYSRPGVKDREIWGKLVPYGLAPNPFGNGKPMPWRAGADENTTITLSHEAKINGNPLAAGKYGLHILVYEDEWTIIFSKDSDAWGSFFYEEINDALRIKVKPQEGEYREWLMYGFENLTAGSCDAYLAWGKVKTSFNIAFDRHAIVLDTYRKNLTALAGFNQADWGAAARYCMQNNINTEEAMVWIDKALGMNGGQNFNNHAVKAGLLTLQGKKEEGDKLLESSLKTATEVELNNYGYQLMNQNQMDDAITIFKINVKNHPDSWNTYDSLGEALNNKGDKKGARANYEKAYDMAPANQKARIEEILKNL